MNFTARPFRINLGFLINQPAGFQREIPFEFNQYQFDEEFIVSDLQGMITLARTLNGVRALGEFDALTTVDCGRCLEPFSQALHPEFEEIFAFASHPLSEEEDIIPEDGNIDFEPILREYLLLEVPYTPVCQPDCKGLCEICGQNLNESLCEHYEAQFQPDEHSSVTGGKPQTE